MKCISTIMLALVLASCSVKRETGELVKMPKGYTNQQTKAFVQTLITPDLVKHIHAEFPNISKQKKGRFDFYPVILTGQHGDLTESAVIVKITGLEGWNRRDEFKQFLISYLRSEVRKLPSR